MYISTHTQVREGLLSRAETGSRTTAFPESKAIIDAIERYAPFTDWLEDAVLAGCLPDFDGIEAALQAHKLQVVRWAEEAGASGDEVGWLDCFASAYRNLIAVLEEAVADFERRGAIVKQRIEDAPDSIVASLSLEDAEASLRRARRALHRADLARDDEATFAREIDRYVDLQSVPQPAQNQLEST